MDGLGGWSRLITSLRYAYIFAMYSGKGLQNIFSLFNFHCYWKTDDLLFFLE